METTATVTAPAAGRFVLAALPARSKMMLAAGVAALVALMVASVLWSRQPDWRVLFANLSDRDGGAVIASLSQMNVPYKHADGGAAILVPADKVHDVRLKLASQGLPKGGTVGFELMENQKFGTTQFQERLNFQRGLEGELARSIQALAAVSSARVHLAMPNQTAFLREQQKPSASVLLTLHGGRTLDRAQVAGIVHLVASSVPELAPKNVSVIDQSGTLLSAQDEAGGAVGGLDPAQLQYTRQIEATLAQRVAEIVEPIVGRGNVRAQVTAEVDFTIAESTAEQYRPNQGSEPAAVRSQQVAEGGGTQPGPQGVPGAMSNQPPPPTGAPINGQAQAMQPAQGAAGAAGGSRREAVTNYEVDKTVRVVRSATGTLKRISAAVVVDHRRVTDPNGKVTVTPLTPQQIEQINALVRDAIGYSKDRGDSINVVNAPFTQDEAPKSVEPSFWEQPDMVSMARELGVQALLAVLALVMVFAVIRPAMRRVPPPPPVAAPERALEAVVGDDLALPAPAGSEATLTAAQQALQLARDNPASVANVVRNWMNGAT